jgi:hypothetical protein
MATNERHLGATIESTVVTVCTTCFIKEYIFPTLYLHVFYGSHNERQYFLK